MGVEPSDVSLFPRRFEVHYSVDEILRTWGALGRRRQAMLGTQDPWFRLFVFAALASTLASRPFAYGSLAPKGVSLVAALMSLAFILGAYAAGMEGNAGRKKLAKAVHGLGPLQVLISDEAIAVITREINLRL